jgi:hypothetical protein
VGIECIPHPAVVHAFFRYGITSEQLKEVESQLEEISKNQVTTSGAGMPVAAEGRKSAQSDLMSEIFCHAMVLRG